MTWFYFKKKILTMAEMIVDYVFKYANAIKEGKEMAEMNLVYISKYASNTRTRPRNDQNDFS